MIQGLDMSTYQRADMKCGIGSLIARETCAFFFSWRPPLAGCQQNTSEF